MFSLSYFITLTVNKITMTPQNISIHVSPENIRAKGLGRSPWFYNTKKNISKNNHITSMHWQLLPSLGWAWTRVMCLLSLFIESSMGNNVLFHLVLINRQWINEQKSKEIYAVKSKENKTCVSKEMRAKNISSS